MVRNLGDWAKGERCGDAVDVAEPGAIYVFDGGIADQPLFSFSSCAEELWFFSRSFALQVLVVLIEDYVMLDI